MQTPGPRLTSSLVQPSRRAGACTGHGASEVQQEQMSHPDGPARGCSRGFLGGPHPEAGGPGVPFGPTTRTRVQLGAEQVTSLAGLAAQG